jgi:hypothetical protein
MNSPYPPQQVQLCLNCFYCASEEQVGYHHFRCLRYAPKPSDSGSSSRTWPSVKANSWCGEWAPKEAAE